MLLWTMHLHQDTVEGVQTIDKKAVFPGIIFGCLKYLLFSIMSESLVFKLCSTVSMIALQGD